MISRSVDLRRGHKKQRQGHDSSRSNQNGRAMMVEKVGNNNRIKSRSQEKNIYK